MRTANVLNPYRVEPRSYQDLEIYFHLCPGRIMEFFTRNGMGLHRDATAETFQVLLVLGGFDLKMVYNMPLTSTRKVTRAVSIWKDNTIKDWVAV